MHSHIHLIRSHFVIIPEVDDKFIEVIVVKV